MQAVILLGTLKNSTSSDFSHTEILSRLLVEDLLDHGVHTDMVRLADYTIPPGLKNDMGGNDQWPLILKKIFAADIVILATPIWWGSHSSIIQRVIERMDELNDEIAATGKSELLNKVGGMVITGAEDGAQHVIASLANFMIWNGLTLPPACSLSYLGSYQDETASSLLEKFRAQSYTRGMAKTMARNLAHLARTLKNNPLEALEKDAQALR